MSEELLYNDDTKLKDLTVGQLKDLIIELLVSNTRYYNYEKGHFIPPRNPYFNPNEPYCSEGIQNDVRGQTIN